MKLTWTKKKITFIIVIIICTTLLYVKYFIKERTELPKEILNAQNIELYNELGEKVFFSDLVKDRSVLVFRFSELNCEICVEEEIKRLKVLSKSIKNRLLFVTSYSFERYLYTFKRINNFKLPIYNIVPNKIKIPVEELNIPYYFVLDSALNIHDIFVPEKTEPENTEKYFKDIILKHSLNKFSEND